MTPYMRWRYSECVRELVRGKGLTSLRAVLLDRLWS